MTTRITSIEVYKYLEENDILSDKRWDVYRTVYKHGPMTSAEAFAKMTQGTAVKSITQSRARFTELREMGLFQEVGKKICSITGHEVILWDVTNNLPTKIVVPETKKQKVDKLVLELEQLHILSSDIFERQSIQEKANEIINQLKKL